MSPLKEIRPASTAELEQAHWLNRHIGSKHSKVSPFEEMAFEVSKTLEQSETASLVFTGNQARLEAHRSLWGVRKNLKILGIPIKSTSVEPEPGTFVILIRKNLPEK